MEIDGCVSNAQHAPGEHAPLIDWSIDDRWVIGARSHQEPPGATRSPSISRSIQIETTAADVWLGFPARRPQNVISWLYSQCLLVGCYVSTLFHVSMSGYLRIFACLFACVQLIALKSNLEIYVVYCAMSCNVPVPSMQWSLAQGWTQKRNTLQCGPMQCNALCCAERQTKLMICNVKKI